MTTLPFFSCILQTLFKRVASIDEFFDIIYAAHSENGHVGQSQTFRAVRLHF